MPSSFHSLGLVVAAMPALLPVLYGGRVSSLALAAEATCYFPDGSVSSNDTPCTSAKTTHCCNSQNACLSIGYCLSAEQAPYVINRGSCTSSSWGTGCPTLCSASSNNPSGGMPISWLGKRDSSGKHLYCCGGLVNNSGNVTCANSADPFTLEDSSIIFGAAILVNATNTTSAPAETNSLGSSVITVTATATAAAEGTGASVSAVGAGVGVSLGVLSLTAMAWALWERRQRKRQLANLVQYNYDQPQQQQHKYADPRVLVELSGMQRQAEEMPTH